MKKKLTLEINQMKELLYNGIDISDASMYYFKDISGYTLSPLGDHYIGVNTNSLNEIGYYLDENSCRIVPAYTLDDLLRNLTEETLSHLYSWEMTDSGIRVLDASGTELRVIYFNIDEVKIPLIDAVFDMLIWVKKYYKKNKIVS